MRKLLLCLSLLLGGQALLAQNTIALTQQDHSKSSLGYNLIYPHNQGSVFLLDNCGRIVHRWDDNTTSPGNSAYIQDNGDIIIGNRPNSFAGDPIWAPGGGANIERRDWGNNLVWSYTLNDSTARLHHDHAVLPNGNVLAITWIYKSSQEAIDAGRDPGNIAAGELWPDAVFELKPNGQGGATVAWEWHTWDHLIQDFDSTKANYGIVGEHPELVDINYGNPVSNASAADWQHVNAIAYNSEYDHIVLSVPAFNEVWVIDHSTTTAEAATHAGGTAGKGGDLLFRWGNPEAYRRGDSTDIKLKFQHDIHWADDFLPRNNPNYGKMVVFNNQIGPDFSEASMFSPVWVDSTKSYAMDGNGTYLPSGFDWVYRDPVPQNMFSSGLSSVQLLENGNKLICVGRTGRSFELDSNDVKIWEYITPLSAGLPLAQGDPVPAPNANLTFRMKRYPWNHPAFAGRTLVGNTYIETNPNTTFCPLPAVAAEEEFAGKMEVFPNPASTELFIEREAAKPATFDLIDMQGRTLRKMEGQGYSLKMDVSDLKPGMYLLRQNGQGATKVLIQR